MDASSGVARGDGAREVEGPQTLDLSLPRSASIESATPRLTTIDLRSWDPRTLNPPLPSLSPLTRHSLTTRRRLA